MFSLKELKSMLHQERHKTKEEWEKEICGRMRRSNYGINHDYLSSEEYSRWKFFGNEDMNNSRYKFLEMLDDDDFWSKGENEYNFQEHLSVSAKEERRLEEEEFSKLIEMLRKRHNIKRNKRLLF